MPQTDFFGDMELFSEVYGCYFNVVSEILRAAEQGLTRAEIEQLAQGRGFAESSFYLLPQLFSGEWQLLEERDGKYYSRAQAGQGRAMTLLEKSWLRALLDDPRIRLFLDETQYTDLAQTLADIPPLFTQAQFHRMDAAADADDFADPEYRARFGLLLNACQTHRPVKIHYESARGSRMTRVFYPHRLEYSAKDDKFRLLCAAFHPRQKALRPITLNLARITQVWLHDGPSAEERTLDALYREELNGQPMVLEISPQRNALERFMLQFASCKRRTQYDPERDIYTCRLYYRAADEAEILIRILSFGPTLRVLEPESVVKQIRTRLERQMGF